MKKFEEIKNKSDETKKLLEQLEAELLKATDPKEIAELKETGDALRAALLIAEVVMMRAFAEEMLGAPIEFVDNEQGPEVGP